RPRRLSRRGPDHPGGLLAMAPRAFARAVGFVAACAVVCVIAGARAVEQMPTVQGLSDADRERRQLETKKLEEEVQKLEEEIATLRRTTTGLGQALPWLQAAGVGSLIGGLLVLWAGRKLGGVQKDKLEQELGFSRVDHELQTRKLTQEIAI